MGTACIFFNTRSGLALLLIMVCYFFLTVQARWIGHDGYAWKEIHRSDVTGYYGYLLSTIIRGDLGEEEYDHRYIHETPTGTLNKYFAGTSVMMAPWFLVGHGVAKALDTTTNGLSAPYLISISIGALFYALIGLLAFRALLREQGVDDTLVAVLLLVLGFGTLLMQYTTMQPGWTHVYSFCVINLSFLLLWTWVGRITACRAMGLGVLLGLVVLIRPVNGLVLLGVPVVLGARVVPFIRSLWNNKRVMITGVIGALAVISIQLILWHAQTGNWLEYGYRGEGFHWTRPKILQVLFSFRRGLFVYTPVLLMCIAAMVLLWRNDRWRTGWTVAYFLANTYVISSWWIWDYGGGFGQRPYIEHYPVLFLILALTLQEATNKVRRTLVSLTGIISIFSLLQWWQYHRGIIAHEYMNAQKYAHVFMRFGKNYEHRLGGSLQIPPYYPNGLEQVFVGSTELPASGGSWGGGKVMAVPRIAYSKPDVCVLNGEAEFSTTLRLNGTMIPTDRPLYLRTSMMRYATGPGASDEALCVVAIEDREGEKSYYKAHVMEPIRPAPQGEWERLQFSYELPPIRPGEELAFYVWYRDLGEFYLDDLQAEVQAVVPY